MELILPGRLILRLLLFIAQGDDRIESRRFPGGPKPEDQPDADAGEKADDGGPEWNIRGKDEFYEQRHEPAEKQAEQTAHARESHGFDEKLPHDIASPAADGFSDADFPSSLGDADQHDIHDADAADHQADR